MPQAEQEEPRLKRKRKAPQQFIIDPKRKNILKFTKKEKAGQEYRKTIGSGVPPTFPLNELVYLPSIALATNTGQTRK